MSKKNLKKISGGSTTMTLKDFHGGSIPSELPLPSAPGISARQPDRPGSWGTAAISAGASSGGRADPHRPRPGSSGGLPRVLEDRGPAFLSTPTIIGRHFDEDERKPFDAASTNRRPSVAATDPSRSSVVAAAPASAQSELKRPVSSPVVAHHLSPSPGVSTSSAGNAWAARKEAVAGGGVSGEPLQDQPSVTWSGPAAAFRFAQASAIEKVSSGRWQSKPPDMEVIRFQEVESLDRRPAESVRIGNVEEVNSGRASRYSGVKDRNFGCLHSDVVWQQERVRSPLYPEVKERNGLGFQSDVSRPVSREGRLAASQYQQAMDEALDRPKLKLFPRTKPLEGSDAKILDGKQGSVMQGYQYPASLIHLEQAQEMRGPADMLKPGPAAADAVSRPAAADAVSRPAAADAVSRPAERQKLNLKPRSQPVEQQDESSERERKTVFGGARPRELVLKERGVDATEDPETLAQANWGKPDILKVEPKLEPAASSFNHQIERVESSPAERRNARDGERKGNRPSHEKVDAQTNPRKNENWRSPRDTEKKPVERIPEPETWRKPVEPPKPETPPGPRVGKAASALELAQAFSRSVSDSRIDNRYPNQKMLPGRTQAPFSRLTDTREIYSGSNQRQINGY